MAENKRLEEEISRIKQMKFEDLQKVAISKSQVIEFLLNKNAELRNKLKSAETERDLNYKMVDCGTAMAEACFSVIDKYNHFEENEFENLKSEDIAYLSLHMIETYLRLWLFAVNV